MPHQTNPPDAGPKYPYPYPDSLPVFSHELPNNRDGERDRKEKWRVVVPAGLVEGAREKSRENGGVWEKAKTFEIDGGRVDVVRGKSEIARGNSGGSRSVFELMFLVLEIGKGIAMVGRSVVLVLLLAFLLWRVKVFVLG